MAIIRQKLNAGCSAQWAAVRPLEEELFESAKIRQAGENAAATQCYSLALNNNNAIFSAVKEAGTLKSPAVQK